MNTTKMNVAKRQPKERTSLFLDPGSLESAAQIAAMQSAANPHRDEVSVSSVLREAMTIGLELLQMRHPSHTQAA
jgi:hypothetical protein